MRFGCFIQKSQQTLVCIFELLRLWPFLDEHVHPSYRLFFYLAFGQLAHHDSDEMITIETSLRSNSVQFCHHKKQRLVETVIVCLWGHLLLEVNIQDFVEKCLFYLQLSLFQFSESFLDNLPKNESVAILRRQLLFEQFCQIF